MKRIPALLKASQLVLTLMLVPGMAPTFAAKQQANCVNNMASPITNFCEVRPDELWRGAKPDKQTSAWLIDKGVKTIVNLELLHDDLDAIRRAKVSGTDHNTVDYYRVKTWEPLYAVAESAADEDVIHFLAVARQAKKPLYVHCRAGENRTGVMVAAYKIVIDNQTSDAELASVIEEMQSYKGFWSDATSQYIKGLAQRREVILQAMDAYVPEPPTAIDCQNGKCESSP